MTMTFDKPIDLARVETISLASSLNRKLSELIIQETRLKIFSEN